MQNQLYYGDNLDVLRRKIPSDSVDLCYIDPPFNSKRNYFQIYNNQGSEDRAQAQPFACHGFEIAFVHQVGVVRREWGIVKWKVRPGQWTPVGTGGSRDDGLR